MTGAGPAADGAYHVPVLCKAVLDGLITSLSGIYVDGTVGGGGHASVLLDALADEGRVFGIDQDPDALSACRERFSNEPRFSLLQGNFADMKSLLSSAGVDRVHGILLDLGVSSHQIDSGGRGFSYREDGPLDMRMDQSRSLTAGRFVNEAGVREITGVIRRYGEEPRARRIAEAIVNARPVASTRALVDVVADATPAQKQVKTLSRVFQAIRIHVNDELAVLEQALADAVDLLHVGGRIAVISYHSLEDRRTKRFFRAGNLDGEQVRDVYGNVVAPLKAITRKAIVADAKEQEDNPRSRSARLRIAERTQPVQ